jgi:hypothetical protein
MLDESLLFSGAILCNPVVCLLKIAFRGEEEDYLH